MTTIRDLTLSVTGCTGVKTITLRESYSQASVSVEVVCTGTTLRVGSENIEITMGYADENAVMLSGGIVKEMHWARPATHVTLVIHDVLIKAVDNFIAADDQNAPFTASNLTAEELVRQLLALSGITNYTSDASGFTFGVVEPTEINLVSAWDEIDNICRIAGFLCYADASGQVHFANRRPYPGDSESAEDTLTTGDSGDILNIEYVESDEKLRNRVVVYGANGLHATRKESSIWLPSNFYKTLVVAHPLIDTQSAADKTAQVNLEIFNRLTKTARVRAKGIPTIRCRDIVAVTENYTGLSGTKFFVFAAEHLIDREAGYVMDLTLTMPIGTQLPPSPGGGSSGSATDGFNTVFGLARAGNGAGIVIGTENFTSGSPTWHDASGSGATRIDVASADPLVFRLDPFDPEHNAYVLTEGGLWMTNNIRDANPIWTNILTAAQMRAATDSFALFTETLIMSPNDQGYAALVIVSTTGARWFGRTSNAPDGAATWSWTQNNNIDGSWPNFWISQHTTDRVWISATTKRVLYSSDGGSSFGAYTLAGADVTNPLVIFIPYHSNDTIIYVGTSGGAQQHVLKSTTGPIPSAFADISPVVSGVNYSPAGNQFRPEAFTESPSSTGSNLFLAAYQDFQGKSALFRYDGSTWTTLQAPVADTSWQGYGFGGWPYNSLQLQKHDAGFGAGHIGRTLDGGVTWIEATGNLLTLQATTVKVTWITPVWTALG